MESSMEVHREIKIKLPYDPAIPLFVIYPKELKSRFWRDICTPMFNVVLLTMAKMWKQSKFLWIDEQIMWCIHTAEYCLSLKKKEIMPHVTTWMNLEKVKWNKSITEVWVLHGSMSMSYLKESNSWKQRAEWSVPGAEGRGKCEVVIQLV